jgi:hypothetical protein
MESSVEQEKTMFLSIWADKFMGIYRVEGRRIATVIFLDL